MPGRPGQPPGPGPGPAPDRRCPGTARRRQRRLDALRSWESARVEVPGRGGARLVRGRVVEAWTEDAADAPPRLPLDGAPSRPPPDRPASLFSLPEPGPPVSPQEAEELLCVAAWLDRHAGSAQVVDEHGPLAWPLPPVPSFHPARAPKPRVLRR